MIHERPHLTPFTAVPRGTHGLPCLFSRALTLLCCCLLSLSLWGQSGTNATSQSKRYEYEGGFFVLRDGMWYEYQDRHGHQKPCNWFTPLPDQKDYYVGDNGNCQIAIPKGKGDFYIKLKNSNKWELKYKAKPSAAPASKPSASAPKLPAYGTLPQNYTLYMREVKTGHLSLLSVMCQSPLSIYVNLMYHDLDARQMRSLMTFNRVDTSAPGAFLFTNSLMQGTSVSPLLTVDKSWSKVAYSPSGSSLMRYEVISAKTFYEEKTANEKLHGEIGPTPSRPVSPSPSPSPSRQKEKRKCVVCEGTGQCNTSYIFHKVCNGRCYWCGGKGHGSGPGVSVILPDGTPCTACMTPGYGSTPGDGVCKLCKGSRKCHVCGGTGYQ